MDCAKVYTPNRSRWLSLIVAIIGPLCLSLTFSGCTGTRAKEALTIQPEALELRRLQTKRFETTDEMQLLSSALDVLQDLGFEIDETESALGVITASKNRAATSTGEMIGSFVVAGLSDAPATYDVEQKIRSSIVTRRIDQRYTTIRVTFQRTVWNNRGEISLNQSIEDPTLYQEFFTKLAASVFLTPLNP